VTLLLRILRHARCFDKLSMTDDKIAIKVSIDF
jgi:hypothetical protein